METIQPRIAKTEVISSDKYGTLEKLYFDKEARTEKHEDGTETTKLVTPWELRATGRKLQELRGAFKESAPQMLHDGWKEWQKHGEEKITKPDGTTDVVRADKVHLYRDQPGFCVSRIRPGLSIDGFGGMKRQGILRQRIRWHREEKITETVYTDGRKETSVG